MTEQEKEKMLELLSDQAIFGLSDEELAALAALEKDFPEASSEAESLELSAAAIGIMNLDTSEPMPAHLQAKVLADAEKFFAARETSVSSAVTQEKSEEETQKTFSFEPKSSGWMKWFGWAVAGFACVALAINVWTTRVDPTNLVKATPSPTAEPKREPTLAEQREQLLASAKDLVQTAWTDFDPEAPKSVEGDVVWSNSQQKGFVRFRNLPVNDKTQESYQLWIFDKAQKNPISGGVFDVNENGELIVPIDAAIKVAEPTMFGVTAERPGGVMVPDLKKVMAVAKLSA